MDLGVALQVHDIFEEMKLNTKDTKMLENAVENGIEGVQITIKSKNGIYNSTVYKHNRINLLLQVLYEENSRLLKMIEEL